MLTILLVDDEYPLLRVLQALLDGAGFHVLAASRACEALEMCRQAKIDLLLTNVNIRDLPAPQLVMEVVDLQPNVRVLYMFGSDAENPSAMGFSSIEAGLLRKPFSPADLLNAVDGVLNLTWISPWLQRGPTRQVHARQFHRERLIRPRLARNGL